ncbi:MAG: penicillin-binding protein activator, partial [Nitrosomonadales bacterium]|nr:penicillin-binding protein activator [Nitrosomonadales bacterium]
MLTTEDAGFNIYKEAAAELPEGMMQRWFALGVDAYQVLTVIAAQSGNATSIRGLTGRIQIGVGGSIERTLAVGRFAGDGVVLEQAP